jgi:hypothetical protein
MKLEVKTKLDEIFNYPFFENVGKPLSPTVTPLKSWAAAAKMCRSYKWETCQLMARNLLQRLTEKLPWQRAEEWNPLSDELRPLILAFVDSLLVRFPLKDKALKNVRDALSWDIMLICFEHSYTDVIKPPFYIPIVEPWYVAGHFPCGRDGDEFPDRWDGIIKGGQLMVF